MKDRVTWMNPLMPTKDDHGIPTIAAQMNAASDNTYHQTQTDIRNILDCD